MARFITDYSIETVADLRRAIADKPDDMEVCDGVGELACVRVYEDENGRSFLEVV